MPKYRHLTKEELDALQKEFVEFLVVNGITADKWTAIKEHKKEVAEEVIEQFSDVVWEGVLRKAKFLEHRSPQEIRTFQCLPEKIVLMGLKVNNENIDLTTVEGFKAVQQNTPQATVYSSEKEYNKKREEELFEMIQNGCEITDGAFFKRIALAVAEKK
jgi:hypothetical protein